MMGEVRHETRAVFLATLALNTPEERARYLDEACKGNPELRQRVEELLQAYDPARKFLGHDALGGELNCPGSSVSEGPGTMISHYKLLEQIGEGGFGVVFMAEQLAPLRRQVALKIVKPGMDTKQVIARFEAERQALALMDHPNIARVFDAGATETGRPYFVMELVRGIPITRFCDANDLTPSERLKLFMTVCGAVQHAHQKGIIHRDLKPSNILVTLHDGKPVPKVIDFGTAKALQQPLTEKTLFTAYGRLIGTPQYMSPEQAEMSGLDVDTRADIYSLGVLLYELLTGTTPFEAERLRGAAFDEMMRIIREEDPPKPSTRISTLGARATEIAKHRQVDPKLLQRSLRGDLDWIVMKALDKDRARRYETANALADELQRDLDHQPVRASPPGTVYRGRKFIRRHRMGVALAASVSVALIAGLTAALIGFTQARQERDRAETNYLTAREAVDRVLSRLAADLEDRPDMMQIRRSLLEDALEFHRRFLEQKGHDPELRHTVARTYMRMGDIYMKLGQHEKSVEAFGQALALLEILAQAHPSEAQYREEMASVHDAIAANDLSLDRPTDGIGHHRKALALREVLQQQFPDAPEYSSSVIAGRVGLGNWFGEANMLKEALAEHEKALQLYEERRARFPNLPEDPLLLAHVRHWLGGSLERVGRFEEAEQQYRQARSLRIQYVAGHPESGLRRRDLAHVNFYLANLLISTGQPREAERLLREAVATDDELLEAYPDHAVLGRQAGNHYRELGNLLGHVRRTEEAEAALGRAVAIYTNVVRKAPGELVYPQGLAWALYELGQLLHATGRSQEAAQAFGQAIGLLSKAAFGTPDRATDQQGLGLMLANCPDPQFRDPARALTLAQKALQLRPESQRCWRFLGVAQYRAGDPVAAIEALQKSLELLGYDEPQHCLYLAMAHWQKGEPTEARRWYEKARVWMEKYHPARDELLRLQAEAQALLGEAPAR